MNECIRLEVDIDCGQHDDLIKWATRLGTTPEEIVSRAVAAWLSEMDDEN